ncbi:anti-sigma factor antagonist [Streptomyces sp. RKAG337]|uniref:anti-sigma factor antagonist n=1 Tax=Streptomyces sp. RKAG337 TaxID=2893404 RepID=UPI002033C8CF|nr:anti-sigma factor antagonist [Streptomyces sp. RKAG337]MCM2425147.1 anti-sigma factor antagonist [Streptomyces sp. RKAG337]
MTIQWHYTTLDGLGLLSVSGFLGADSVSRFGGAVGWVQARGAGPVILDLALLQGWSAAGQEAVTEAARRLAAVGRPLELAAIPADGLVVPADSHPPVTIHCDLAAALTAHQVSAEDPSGQQEWRTTGWPNNGVPATA